MENKKSDQYEKNNPENQELKDEEDPLYQLNLKKGSPLNPKVTNIRSTPLPNNETESLCKDQLIALVLESVERPIEPYKTIIEDFRKANVVAAHILADGISDKQLGAGLEKAIEKCNIEDIRVEVIPAKIVLMRTDFNIGLHEEDSENPAYTTFSL
jgi:hypothetical protein